MGQKKGIDSSTVFHPCLFITIQCTLVIALFFSQNAEHFHMTLLQPCWCFKQILWELNSFLT